MNVRCPACSQLLEVPDEAVGKTALCPKCGHRSSIPSSAPSLESIDKSRPIAILCLGAASCACAALAMLLTLIAFATKSIAGVSDAAGHGSFLLAFAAFGLGAPAWGMGYQAFKHSKDRQVLIGYVGGVAGTSLALFVFVSYCCATVEPVAKWFIDFLLARLGAR